MIGEGGGCKKNYIRSFLWGFFKAVYFVCDFWWTDEQTRTSVVSFKQFILLNNKFTQQCLASIAETMMLQMVSTTDSLGRFLYIIKSAIVFLTADLWWWQSWSQTSGTILCPRKNSTKALIDSDSPCMTPRCSVFSRLNLPPIFTLVGTYQLLGGLLTKMLSEKMFNMICVRECSRTTKFFTT